MSQIIIDEFLRIKGQFVKVSWTRPVKMKKTAPFKVFKTVTTVARAGIEYDNIQHVQDKRADGTLPATNAGLPWGKWAVYPYIIEHKDLKYLRFTASKNNNSEVIFKDEAGNTLTSDIVRPYALASEFAEKDEMDVFNVPVPAITMLGNVVIENKATGTGG